MIVVWRMIDSVCNAVYLLLIFMNLDIFKPKYLFYQVEDISIEWLKQQGVAYILLDVDNTIAVWNEEHVADSVDAWIRNVLQNKIKIMLISNSAAARLERISCKYGIGYISWSLKPFNRSFVRGLALMGCTDKKRALVIGDQVFTDVFGGNRLDIATVLLTPRFDKDYIWTKFARKMENIVLRKLNINKKTRV